MILKEKSNGSLKLLILAIAGLAFIFTLYADAVEGENKYLASKWMAFDPGFSSAKSPTQFVTQFVTNLPKIVKGKLFGFEGRPEFERIDIDIKFDDMQTMQADRQKALTVGVLKNPTKVPAKLRYKNRVFKAKVRLKGDLKDHWSSPHRMSLRVSVKGKETISGFKAFSLHKPIARQHPYDQVFQQLHSESGGIAAAHKYMRIFVNGENWGVMNVEEHISKQLLEKQKSKESIVVRFGDEDSWHYRRAVRQNMQVKHFGLSDYQLNIKLYSASKYLENKQYRDWLTYIHRSRMEQSAPYLYDTQKFSRALILARAWNDTHVLAHSNTRYYFNPYTLKLEPITTDQGYFRPLSKNNRFREDTFHPLDLRLYRDVIASEEYSRNLNENIGAVEKALNSSNSIMNEFHGIFPLDRKPLTSHLRGNMRKIKADKKLFLDHKENDVFSNRKLRDTSTEKYRQQVIPDGKARLLPAHIFATHFEDGTIKIYNLLPSKISLLGLEVGKKRTTSFNQIIEPRQSKQWKPALVLNTKFRGNLDGKITLQTQVSGIKRKYQIPYTYSSGKLLNPLLVNNAHEFDFLTRRSGKQWQVKSGTWTIKKPLVVQGDLEIRAGTTLRFESDSYLIVSGTLTSIGSADKRIVFEPTKDTWKGIYVFGGKKQSKLRYTKFINTSALEDGLLKLTGGVTFYRTDVDLDGVQFLKTDAEDAVNLVHSSFRMKKVTVVDTRSDGFDGDFSTGLILSSAFRDVGGDALDFSGSNIDIVNTKVWKVKDKAISVGEATIARVKGGSIRDVGVAIASKDGSQTTVTGTKITKYALSAGMSYIKKPFYGQPSLQMNNIALIGSGNFFRQTDSILSVNNRLEVEQNIDVDTLYKTGIMKK
jgi:hypothetical protein